VAGLAAGAVVLLARMLQGIAMGGEVATAATYVVEVAPPERRHRYGAFAYSGDAFGTLGSTMGVYFGSVYLPQLAAHCGQLSEEAATGQHTIALLALIAALIASGFLADRIGPLALIRVGFTAAALLTLPLMLGFLAGVVPYVVAAPLFTTCVGLQLGVTPVAGARLFPVPIRAVALGIPAALAIALFGGTFLWVAEFLVSTDRISLVPVCATAGLRLSAVGSWLVSYRLMYPVDTLAGTAASTEKAPS